MGNICSEPNTIALFHSLRSDIFDNGQDDDDNDNDNEAEEEKN